MKFRPFATCWLPPLAWAGLIFWLSSLSLPPGKPLFPHADKVVHLLLYAMLAILLVRARRADGAGGCRAFVFALLLSAAYGALDEWHQSFVPTRSMEFADWTADVLGAFLGAMIIFRRPRKGTTPQ